MVKHGATAGAGEAALRPRVRLLVVVAFAVAVVGCKSKAEPLNVQPEAAVSAPLVEPAPVAPALPTEEPAPDAAAAAEWNYPEVKWRSADYGFSKMRLERKPGLVVVMADWCSACRKYQALFRDPEVIELSKRFELILIEGETSPERAAEWNVDGGYFPRTFIATPDGAVDRGFKTSNPRYAHFFGADSRDELIATLREAAIKYASGG